MAEEGRRVEVRMGTFACTIEGYDDPIAKLKEVMGLVQQMISETPALVDVSAEVDNAEVQEAVDARAAEPVVVRNDAPQEDPFAVPEDEASPAEATVKAAFTEPEDTTGWAAGSEGFDPNIEDMAAEAETAPHVAEAETEEAASWAAGSEGFDPDIEDMAAETEATPHVPEAATEEVASWAAGSEGFDEEAAETGPAARDAAEEDFNIFAADAPPVATGPAEPATDFAAPPTAPDEAHPAAAFAPEMPEGAAADGAYDEAEPRAEDARPGAGEPGTGKSLYGFARFAAGVAGAAGAVPGRGDARHEGDATDQDAPDDRSGADTEEAVTATAPDAEPVNIFAADAPPDSTLSAESEAEPYGTEEPEQAFEEDDRKPAAAAFRNIFAPRQRTAETTAGSEADIPADDEADNIFAGDIGANADTGDGSDDRDATAAEPPDGFQPYEGPGDARPEDTLPPFAAPDTMAGIVEEAEETYHDPYPEPEPEVVSIFGSVPPAEAWDDAAVPSQSLDQAEGDDGHHDAGADYTGADHVDTAEIIEPETAPVPEPEPQPAPTAEQPSRGRFSALLQRLQGGPPEPEAPAIPPEAAGLTAAEFAELSGADNVAELLSASAAWLTLANGKPRFSRREVMDVFDTLPGEHPKTLEARIKGYGKLVRSGTLILIDDGVFAMSRPERERFESYLS